MNLLIENIPEWHEINARLVSVYENNDKFINISSINSRVIYEPRYYIRKIPGSIKDCYIRSSVYQMLLKAVALLPEGYGLKIFDAWRPYEVQKFLFYEQVAVLCKKDGLCIEQAKVHAKQFVSYPSIDPYKPFVHSTGGAVDLTIIDENNIELDMGTDFDDFSKMAATDSFENSSNEKVKNNRRLLYSVMIKAGFSNYPSEWWHYDFGDSFWAAENNLKSSLFGGVYKMSGDYL